MEAVSKRVGNAPAFPVRVLDCNASVSEQHLGISLRAYFAAKALQGLLANPKLAGEIRTSAGWLPTAAVDWADRTIAELCK